MNNTTLWLQKKSEYIVSNKWVRLRKDQVVLPENKVIDDFYVIERPNLVHVIAITTDNKFVVEWQYRYAINKGSLEICAGMIEPDETPLEAAKRELKEETGYIGGEWLPYGEYAIDPSNMTDKSYAFVARGVYKAGEQKLDATETIYVKEISAEELVAKLQSGEIISGLMQAPLWRYVAENKLV